MASAGLSEAIRLFKQDDVPIVGRKITDIPLVRDFAISPEWSGSDVPDFYDRYQKYVQDKALVAAWEGGRKTRPEELPSTFRDYLSDPAGYMERVRLFEEADQHMSALRSLRRQVEMHDTLDPKQKRAAVEQINYAILNTARAALGRKPIEP